MLETKASQVYKYCQCKSGTHKINSAQRDDEDKSSAADDMYSYIVDCTRKRVYPTSTYVSGGGDGDSRPPVSPADPGVGGGSGNNDDKSGPIWTIFGSSAAQSQFAPAYVCMLGSLFAVFSTNYLFL